MVKTGLMAATTSVTTTMAWRGFRGAHIEVITTSRAWPPDPAG